MVGVDRLDEIRIEFVRRLPILTSQAVEGVKRQSCHAECRLQTSQSRVQNPPVVEVKFGAAETGPDLCAFPTHGN
jgi:hypothetical protein